MDLHKVLLDHQHKTLKEALNLIYDHVVKADEARSAALDQVSTWNKDEELQKLRLEINKLEQREYEASTISAEERAAIKEWHDKHISEKHGGNAYSGAIGGSLTYKFIPTSIGDIAEVECYCGDTFVFREL